VHTATAISDCSVDYIRSIKMTSNAAPLLFLRSKTTRWIATKVEKRTASFDERRLTNNDGPTNSVSVYNYSY